MNAVDAAGLQQALAASLHQAGVLRSACWRAAVEHVPRELFLGGRVYQRLDVDGLTYWRPRTRQTMTHTQWLELAYRDETLVTQLDYTDSSAEADEPVPGEPTSSATLPSLVVRMLEDLDVVADSTVLEIGTGSGYSTALLCACLGSQHVTSIEVDPAVAERARRVLTHAGYAPTLVCGDGLAGYPGAAPYDRLIATCSVRHIPRPWLHQVRPGGVILAPLSGWLLVHGMARLRLSALGQASGCFLPGFVQVMPARAHAAPPLRILPPMADCTERATTLGPDILNDWMGRFLAQLAAPTACYAPYYLDPDTLIHLIYDHASQAWAHLHRDRAGGWWVRQAGPTNLWDGIEQAVATWRAAGQPPQQQFTLHITPHAHRPCAFTPPPPRQPGVCPLCDTLPRGLGDVDAIQALTSSCRAGSGCASRHDRQP